MLHDIFDVLGRADHECLWHGDAELLEYLHGSDLVLRSHYRDVVVQHRDAEELELVNGAHVEIELGAAEGRADNNCIKSFERFVLVEKAWGFEEFELAVHCRDHLEGVATLERSLAQHFAADFCIGVGTEFLVIGEGQYCNTHTVLFSG